MLIAILGPLGCGKTLGMTFLGLKSYFAYNRRVKLYSNYHLFGVPFIYVKSPEDIEMMHEGIFLGDELWLWLDSRASQSKKNKMISKILGKSRKRGIEIFYTTQDFSQIDKRIRKITDYFCVPMLNKSETLCTLLIYNKYMELKRCLRFRTAKIFDCYDTTEEIEELETEDDREKERMELKKEKRQKQMENGFL